MNIAKYYRHGGSTFNKYEHTSYRAMIERCYKKRYARYDRYGGRGIKVCQRWLGKSGFINFLNDMGKKPTNKHELDRIDNDGNYTPSNCRWATRNQQMSNTSRTRLVTILNETKTFSQWCREYGTTPAKVHNRLRCGWKIEDAITIPPNIVGKKFTKPTPAPIKSCEKCSEPCKEQRNKYCSPACYNDVRWGERPQRNT